MSGAYSGESVVPTRGVGLAGELGAGITLVAELTSRERRGLATTIVATVGILGAVVAYFITQLVTWRVAFAVGGVLGLALLVLLSNRSRLLRPWLALAGLVSAGYWAGYLLLAP